MLAYAHCCRRLSAASLVLALFGCGDAAGPTAHSVGGSYRATSFLVTGADGSTDYLAAGATLFLTLRPAGQVVEGRLTIPEALGGPLEVDLSGTFVLDGEWVRIRNASDTFVRSVPWRIGDGTLTAADEAGGGARVSATLTRD